MTWVFSRAEEFPTTYVPIGPGPPDSSYSVPIYPDTGSVQLAHVLNTPFLGVVGSVGSDQVDYLSDMETVHSLGSVLGSQWVVWWSSKV